MARHGLPLGLKRASESKTRGVGDLIALTFLGKKSRPTGRSYNAYCLIVGRTVTVLRADIQVKKDRVDSTAINICRLDSSFNLNI